MPVPSDRFGTITVRRSGNAHELLGPCLGMFSERVDVSADDKLIERLILGRRRAAKLLNQEPEEDEGAEEKPN